jgi:hypothetical protein
MFTTEMSGKTTKITCLISLIGYLIHMTFVPTLFGLPLYLYLGIITFAALITTATLGYLFLKGKFGVKFIWHKYMAITTIVLAIIHATLVVSAYFF